MENNNNMSRSDTLDELNEYFNDANTDQKLADFFMRKRKGPPSKGSLFGNIPMPKFDFNVKLIQRKKSPPRIEKDEQGAAAVQEVIVSPLKEVQSTNISVNRPQSGNSKQKIPAPAVRTATYQTTEVSKIPIPEKVSSRICVARSIYGRSSQRRSDAASDMLRRSAIRRRSKSANCRNLLIEFENSPENFLPRVCSTPASIYRPSEAMVPEPSRPSSTGSASNTLTDSEPLMHSLQRHDKQLQELLDGALEKTIQEAKEISAASVRPPSPTSNQISDSQKGNTYTVEEGSMPGQVILTPTKSKSQYVALNTQPLKSAAVLKSPRVLLRNITIDEINNQKENHLVDQIVVLNTPTKKNNLNKSLSAAALNESEIFIPETQEIPALNQAEPLINPLQRTGSPTVVVLPMYQTFNTTPKSLISNMPSDNNNGNSECRQKTEEKTPCKATTDDTQMDPKCVQKDIEHDVHKQHENTNKSIQTSDILEKKSTCPAESDGLLTDDESEEEPQILEANSPAPLNLHMPDSNLTPINGRQKNLRRKQAITRNKSPDYVLNLRRQAFGGNTQNKRLRKQQQTLNKAPRTPINGETFAKELIRLTNYEILDLRKRNSMGKVFPLCGNKSENVDEQRVLKNQIELEEKLAMEIAKRNFTGESFNFEQQLGVSQPEAMLPAPEGFDDNSGISLNSSKARVSKTNICRRTQNLPMTETLKNYLNAPLSVKIRKKSNDNSKRRLYTKGNSDSGESPTSSPENIVQTKSKKNIEIIQSPPSSRALRLSEISVVPPPPPTLPETSFAHTINKNDHGTRQALNKDIEILHTLSFASKGNPEISIQDSEKQNTRQNHTVETNTEQLLPVGLGCNEQQMEPLRLDTLSPPLEATERSTHFAVTSSEKENVQKHVHSPANKLKYVVNDGELASTSRAALKRNKSSASNDEVIFKKPLLPVPKTKNRGKLQKKERKVEEQCAEITGELDSSLRRSKRVHVPYQSGRTLLFQMLAEREWGKRLDKAMERHKQKKERSRLGGATVASITCSDQPICSSTPLNIEEQAKRKRRSNNKTANNKNPHASKESKNANSLTSEKAENRNNLKRPKSKSKAQKKNKSEKNNEQKRSVDEPKRVPVEDINTMFDRLKGGSLIEETPPEQEVQSATEVELRNENVLDNSNKDAEVQTTSTTGTSQSELITWLKEGGTSDSVNFDNETLHGMYISSRSNLTYTDLEGIDYAFYATEEKASLGYMRFKPKQLRPTKRAKTYNLHFVVFSGQFVIQTFNDQEHRDNSRILVPGDMVVIEKGTRYSIENMDDDISILMVFKK